MSVGKIQLVNQTSKLETKTPINEQEQPNTDPVKSKAAKLMIGATALAGIVALGISGYKGKLGKSVQRILGGAEKAAKPNPETNLATREAERAVKEAQEKIKIESERILKEIEDEPKRAKEALELSNARNEEWVQKQHQQKEKEYEKIWLNAEKEKTAAIELKHQQEINKLLNADLTTKSKAGLDEFHNLIDKKIEDVKKHIDLKKLQLKRKFREPLNCTEKQYDDLIDKRLKIYSEKGRRQTVFLETKLAKPTDKEVITENANRYLNEEEKRVLDEYYDIYPHNSALRSGVDPTTIEDVVILDRGFKKAPALKEDAVVYRAVHGHSVIKSQNKFISSLKEGMIITDPSYVSTSVNTTNGQFSQFAGSAMGENGGVLMRIKLPKGTKGILGGYDEYLLPRNSQIKINKIERIDGHRIADCEYILPE